MDPFSYDRDPLNPRGDSPPGVLSPAAAPPAPPAIDVVAERARTVVGAEDWAEHPLNSAGAALPTRASLTAVTDHLELEAANGGYEATAAARPRLDAVYAAAAELIGAGPDDLALVESATVGWRRAVDAMRLGAGDRVVATRPTYVSSALQLLELERAGVKIEVVPDDDGGHVDLEALERALREPASLLVATHVPTSSGRVEPVAEIGALAAAAGVVYLLDATQSAGQLPVDVGAIGCDALVTTGRKFLRAPRGTGFLYVSPALRQQLRPAAPDVRGAQWSGEHEFELAATARAFETWEAAHALRLGLGVALAEARATGVEAIAAHVSGLAELLRERLCEEVAGIRIADPEEAPCGIVTFVREGEEPQRTQAALARAGCHTVVVPASHGLWDLAPRGLPGVVRASFHVYNGEDEVEAVIEALNGSAAAAPAPARRLVRSLERFDEVVVGAGIHGRSAAWQLARRQRSVLLLERGRLGHRDGSSHGATRMIRRAYPSAAWDDLVERAYRAWAELEAAAETSLLTTTGGLYAHAAEADGGLRGPGCEAVGIEAAREIFPALQLSERYRVLHDPAAGVLDAGGAMEALLRLGFDAGVELRDSSPLLGWEEDEDGVVVETPRGPVGAERLVLCAGPWTVTVVPELAGALRVVRIVNVEFGPEDPAAVAPPALGVFAIEDPEFGLLYGIPAVNGRGLKVGLDDGPPDDPERPAAPVSEAEAAVLAELVARFVPAGAGPVAEGIACRYTMAPRNRFAIGPLPGSPRVLLGAACSGHGFKFGPAVGEALADLASGVERPDLEFVSPVALGASLSPG